jgi:thymidylate kinase
MKIILLEGIATSGKSSLSKAIVQASKSLGVSIAIINEEVTHEPIMKQTDSSHISHFLEIIEKLKKRNEDIVILDRFHLTQAIRSSSSIDAYYGVEEALDENTLLVLLWVEPKRIEDRIKAAAQHRDPAWKSYLQTKGQTWDEISMYYKKQQDDLQKLFDNSMLDKHIIDISDATYEEVAEEILNKVS